MTFTGNGGMFTFDFTPGDGVSGNAWGATTPKLPERPVTVPPPQPEPSRNIADFILDGAEGVRAFFTDAEGHEQAANFRREPRGLPYPMTAHTLVPLRRLVTGGRFKIDGLA